MANKCIAMSQFETVDVEIVSDSSSEWEVVDQSDEEQDTFSFDGISDSGSDTDSVVADLADREISFGAPPSDAVVKEVEVVVDEPADVDCQDRESEISFGSPSDQVSMPPVMTPEKMDMIRRFIGVVDNAAVFAPLVTSSGGSDDVCGQIPFGSPTDDVYVPPVTSLEQRWRTVGVFNKDADVETPARMLPAPIGRPPVASPTPREPTSDVSVDNRFAALQDDEVEDEEDMEEEEDDYGMDVDDELVPKWVMAKFERQRLKKSGKKGLSKAKKVKKLPYYHNRPGCAMVWA